MTQKAASQRMILLVEDNPDDEALTRRALAKNNIQNEVLVAHDGAEALDYLLGTGAHAGHPIAPEVILLDLKLPKVDGLEVLRRIRADDRTRLFAETKQAYGKLDILVNNAGIYEFGPLESVTAEHFHKQFDLNVLGLLLSTQEAVKLMDGKGGSILNISSIVGPMPIDL